MPLAERMRSWWARSPDALGFLIGQISLGYRELAERAAGVAAGLRELPAVESRTRLGILGHGRLLALATGNMPSFAELFVGATVGDGACAVLDPRWPAEQTREVLRRLRPDLLVADAARPETVEVARECGVRVLVAGGQVPAGAEDYADWLAGHRGADPALALSPGATGSTFLIGFTSGSTSLPKAFYRSRGSWRASLVHGGEVFAIGPADRTLAPGPLSHGLGLYALAEALHAGSAFLTIPRFDVAAVRDLLTTMGVTRLVVVPTMLRGLNQESAAAGTSYPLVTTIVSSGAKLDPTTLRRTRTFFPNAHVREYYGASELSFVTVRNTPPDVAEPDDDPDSVGTPFPGVHIEVRGPDGAPLPTGVPGVVHVRSVLACAGYAWGDDSLGFTTDGEWGRG